MSDSEARENSDGVKVKDVLYGFWDSVIDGLSKTGREENHIYNLKLPKTVNYTDIKSRRKQYRYGRKNDHFRVGLLLRNTERVSK